MASGYSSQQEPEPQRTEGTTDEHRGKPQPQMTPATGSAELNPPSPTGTGRPHKPHRDWHDYTMLIVQSVGVAFLIAYTTFAALQWWANKKAADAAHDTLGQIQQQTVLMRQQLVGSQEAVLDLSLIYNDGSGELTWQLNNNGHLNATDIHLKVDASQQRIRDGSLIGEPFQFEPVVHTIPFGKGIALVLKLPWRLTERERQQGDKWFPDWPGTRTFVFHAEVTYQNGFGDQRHQETCKQWLPGFTIPGYGSGGGPNYPCEDFKATIKSVLEQARAAQRTAKPTSP